MFSLFLRAATVSRRLLQHLSPVWLVSPVAIIAMALALSAVAANAGPGRVFLTFDDGPINITLDILDVLKAEDIKATFFVNAIHLDGRGGEHEDRAREALRRIIAEGHVLGNHSYDHMGHNRPNGVYSITASQAYSNVATDLPYFVPDNITPVNAVLGPLATRPNNHIDSLARLPYSNVWMVPHMSRVCRWCGIDSGPYWDPFARANAAQQVSAAGGRLAEALYERYKIITYGWDTQWMPSAWGQPTTNETLPPAAAVVAKILALFGNEQGCTPPGAAISCTRPVRDREVIVLTHDFLFENGARGRGKDLNMPQLVKLIESLKAKGYTFDTLDHYLD